MKYDQPQTPSSYIEPIQTGGGGSTSSYRGHAPEYRMRDEMDNIPTPAGMSAFFTVAPPEKRLRSNDNGWPGQ